MTGETFDIVFAGRLAEGADPALVRANLAKLFKTEPAKVEHLFSGQRVSIKKGVDAATARQYQTALGRAGALAEIVAARALAPTAAPAAVSAVARAKAGGPAETPPAARRETPPIAPDYTVAEPGAMLVEARPVPPAQIDTAHLSLADVGADLVEHRPVAAPDYDLSAFGLAPPGSLLVEPRPVPPAHIDTSALSLAE